jgi:hypothetical protein
MLPSTPQVESVYLGERGLMAGLIDILKGEQSLTDSIPSAPWLLGDGTGDKPNATTAHSLWVDHTTLDPTAARRVAETVHEQNKDVFMVDGPVSGGEFEGELLDNAAAIALRSTDYSMAETDIYRYRWCPGRLAHHHVRLG